MLPPRRTPLLESYQPPVKPRASGCCRIVTFLLLQMLAVTAYSLAVAGRNWVQMDDSAQLAYLTKYGLQLLFWTAVNCDLCQSGT